MNWCHPFETHVIVLARRRDSLGRVLYGYFCTRCRANLTDYPLLPGGPWRGMWLPRWRVLQLVPSLDDVPWLDALDPPPNAQMTLL